MATRRMHAFRYSNAFRQTLEALWLLALTWPATGCGGAVRVLASPALAVTPSSANVAVGEQLVLTARGGGSGAADCRWKSSLPNVLASSGDGVFQARSRGNTTVSAVCGGTQAVASVVVTDAPSGPLIITHGGTYSGHWSSEDWHTPAVQIQTAEPVVLRDATISSRGDLISIARTGSGAKVTVENVTGTALDPETAGVQRGSFVVADGVAALSVSHCTLSGARFGVKVLSSSPATLRITENLATDLEDRASDGQGGFLAQRPDLGHFLMLNRVIAPSGAEIAWNQITSTIGQSSTEDVINVYKSQGSPSLPIAVHDNYIEGNSSPSATEYTGAGLIADGDAAEPETAYVRFERNQVVHTAGSGIEVAAGHDILITGNRITSCGRDPGGDWFAAPFVNAVVVWNFYGVPHFGNIVVQDTEGGVLRPDSNGQAMVADLWARAEDLEGTDVIGPQTFTDPCLRNEGTGLDPEQAERNFWQAKLLNNKIVVGDQPTSP